jgi:hypothetical protein
MNALYAKWESSSTPWSTHTASQSSITVKKTSAAFPQRESRFFHLLKKFLKETLLFS